MYTLDDMMQKASVVLVKAQNFKFMLLDKWRGNKNQERVLTLILKHIEVHTWAYVY